MTAILGGGISGLSAAYYCLENPKLGPYVLYEASNRLGGWIKSNELLSGEIFEQGPRTIRPSGLAGKNTLKLIEDLQLSDKVVAIQRSHPTARNRLIYAKNRLHLLPNSLSSIFKSNTLLEYPLIKYLFNDLKAPKVLKDDESLYSFVERRFGQDIADNLISPMICGICAGDSKKISVNFLMQSLFEGEQKYGSIFKGLLMNNIFPNNKLHNTNEIRTLNDVKYTNLVKRSVIEKWSVWSLKQGLEQLPRGLTNHIVKQGLKLQLNNQCDKIVFTKTGVEITINGEVVRHRRVISSLSAKELSKLIKTQHPKLAEEFEGIPFSTVAVVNLRFAGKILPINAFGFLVPPKEKLSILGCIFDSCLFPSNSTVLTVMMGGAWFEEYFRDNQSTNHLLATAVDHVKNILNVKEDPTEFEVAVLKDCIPQHVVGHKQRLNRIQAYISTHKIPLFLCGSSYQGVGLNDVILSAKQAVSDMASN